MRLTIPRADLLRLLTAIDKVVEARNTIPIISCVLLEADAGQLKITGSDLDIELTGDLTASVEAPGRACVSAKMLKDIVSKFPADAEVLLVVDNDNLKIVSGRSRFSLPVLDPADFPRITSGPLPTTFDADLDALFGPVRFAMSTEGTRYYLQGIFLHVVDGLLTAVATDGHRLARNLGTETADFTGVIVPRKAAGLIGKGTISVALSDTKIQFKTADGVLTSKLVDGTFPDYSRVIPTGNDKIMSADRDVLIKSVDRVSVVSSERGHGIKLAITQGQVALSLRSGDGEAQDEIEVEYEGGALEIGFNSRYLSEVFAQFPAGEIQIALSDGGSPPVITSAAALGLLAIIMPMRVA